MLRNTAIVFLLASVCLAQDNASRMEQVVW